MANLSLYFVAALSLMLPSLNAQSTPKLSLVEGKVIDFQTARPQSPVWVSIDRIDPDTADTIEAADFKTMVSDDSGAFRFDLPPGYYVLRVDDRVKTVIKRNLEIKAGVETRDLRIEMRPVGTIFGKATDHDGNPLVNFTAEVLAFQDFNGSRILAPLPSFERGLNNFTRTASVQTDERGEFQFSDLDSGEYYVRVSPTESAGEATSPEWMSRLQAQGLQ